MNVGTAEKIMRIYDYLCLDENKNTQSQWVSSRQHFRSDPVHHFLRSTLISTEIEKIQSAEMLGSSDSLIRSHVASVEWEKEKNHMSRWYTINLSIIKHGNLLFMIVKNDFGTVGFISCLAILPFSLARVISWPGPSLLFNNKKYSW